MSNNPIHSSKPRPLASLMNMTGDEPTKWADAELGAVLQHQLAAPLEYDLRTIAPGGERMVSDMTATITIGPRPKSFGDLLAHLQPPLELLRLMKDFAKTGRDGSSLPSEVATVLYYGAIVLSLLRHGARITGLDDQSLRKGIAWSAAQPWIDDRLKQIFADGAGKLGK